MSGDLPPPGYINILIAYERFCLSQSAIAESGRTSEPSIDAKRAASQTAQAERMKRFFDLLKDGRVVTVVRDPLTGSASPIPPEAWVSAICPERLLFTSDGAISDLGENANIRTVEGEAFRPFAARVVFICESELIQASEPARRPSLARARQKYPWDRCRDDFFKRVQDDGAPNRRWRR